MRRRRLGVAWLAMAVAGLAAFAPAAPAQTEAAPYIDAVGDWASSQTLRRALPGQSGTGTRKAPTPGAKQPTAKQLATLKFTPSDEVTRRNHARVIANFRPGHDPATVRADLTSARATLTGIIRNQFRWDPNHLGDVTAATILNAYSQVTDDFRLSAPGARIVRLDARRSLAAVAKVRRLTDAAKQTAAEMLELRLIFLLFDLNRARDTSDVAGQTAGRAAIRAFVQEVFRLDLTKVKLTSRGLVRR